MGSFISHYFPPKSLFEVDQIPDLTGFVMIVTGGSTGIGKETCKILLNKNAKVYLAARSKIKAETAIRILKTETNGKEPMFLELDLANFSSIRKAVEEFKSKEQNLHVLFNNAGVMVPPVDQKTVQGYDLQFGTNTLGHYFLTSLLLPTLIYTAKNSPIVDGHVRVVNTSSTAVYHVPKRGITWDTLSTDEFGAAACRRLGTVGLYCQSKLLNDTPTKELFQSLYIQVQSDDLAMFDRMMKRRNARKGIIESQLVRHLAPWITRTLSFLIYPPSYGPLTQLYAGTMPEGKHLSGKVRLVRSVVQITLANQCLFYILGS
ncbi:hypothetical protein FRC12_016365 [Ceratobasidium sp. 428]|nr:hypothetical protein FRC12_016365 [Ceratobasidium sp. 428]